jgi:hypothetical protein
MRRLTFATVLVVSAVQPIRAQPAVVQLQPADILNVKGDGPDGKGNTDDDTWQFWFEVIHAKGTFQRLSLHTSAMPAAQRMKGIPKKVRGPIASMLPNPADTEGWIYHRDWDGRFEGIWADKKTGAILVHPYTEKTDPGALAITYRIPMSGRYQVSGGITDLQVAKSKPHDGVRWRLERPVGKGKFDVVGRGGPIGDGAGPDSTTFVVKDIALTKGDLLRFVIDPINHWGTDLTRIDSLKIERDVGK